MYKETRNEKEKASFTLDTESLKSVKVKVISKDSEVSYPVCPICKTRLHQLGMTNKSRCSDVTIICKLCKNRLSVNIDTG